MMHAAYWVRTWPPITGVFTGFAKPKDSTKPLPPQRVISRRGIRGAKTIFLHRAPLFYCIDNRSEIACRDFPAMTSGWSMSALLQG
jgi:hypothetical protein